MKTKEIVINGVTLRLFKMDAFKQEELVDLIAPVFASFASSIKSDKKGIELVGEILQQVLSALPLPKRHKLIFDTLLAPDYCRQVINGAEMPLIGKADNVQTVMNDNLNDYADLLEIAYESLKFNLANFFTKGQNLLQNVKA